MTICLSEIRSIKGCGRSRGNIKLYNRYMCAYTHIKPFQHISSTFPFYNLISSNNINFNVLLVFLFPYQILLASGETLKVLYFSNSITLKCLNSHSTLYPIIIMENMNKCLNIKTSYISFGGNNYTHHIIIDSLNKKQL